MNPVIILLHPFDGIALIEVYPPKIIDRETISFLIRIDFNKFILLLKDDDSWQARGICGNYDARVLRLIEEKIEQRYLEGKKSLRWPDPNKISLPAIDGIIR